MFRPLKDRRISTLKARARRSAPRVESLEGRELMTFDFKTAIGVGALAGSNNILSPASVAIDALGNTYVTGAITGSARLDPNSQAVATSNGGRDIFVAKYSPNGSLLWTRVRGSSQGDDEGLGLAIDAAGSVYVTGEFTGTVNFATAQGATQNLSANQRGDAFVWKLDTNGNMAYIQQIAGTLGNLAAGYSIAVDGGGNAVVAGSFQAANPVTHVQLPVGLTLGALTLSDAADYAPFVTKLDANGNFLWAKTINGSVQGRNEARGVAVDPAGNVYSAGFFQGTANFNTSGSDVHANNGSQDAYVMKLAPNGAFIYAKTFGGAADDQVNGVAADGAGNVTIFGQFSGTVNFNPNPGPVVSRTTTGFSGEYVSRLDVNGNLVYATDLGTPLSNVLLQAGGVALDARGNAYVTGSYQGTAHIGSYTFPTVAGKTNGFIAQVSPAGKILQAKRLNTAGNIFGQTIAVNPSGTIASAGIYDTPAALGSFIIPPTSQNSINMFLTTLTRRTPGDFNGDGKTDLTVYNNSTATLAALQPGVTGLLQQFGTAGHDNAPTGGDYDGDGKADIAIFDRTTTTFSILYSGGGGLVQQFGFPGHDNIPIAGDFDGDGKTDLAVFDRTNGFISSLSSSGRGGVFQQFGVGGHDTIPIAADFDGDGKTDIAIYDRTNSTYSSLFSGGGGIIQQFGITGHDSVPMAADFDGDGKTDIAIFDRTNSTLSSLYSGGGGILQQFGTPGHDNIALAGDYDGDGKTDIAIYDRTNATFSILYSGGSGLIQQFGDPTQGTNLRPIPTAFNPGLTIRSAQALSVASATDPVLIAPTPDVITTSATSRKKGS